MAVRQRGNIWDSVLVEGQEYHHPNMILPDAVPKIIQDERQSGEIPLGLATCTFPPWSTVAQMNTSFGVKSLPTNSAVSCKRFEKLVQKLLQVAGRGYWSKFETGKINAS